MRKSDWIFLASIILIFIGLRVFVYFPAEVEGISMMSTLETHNHGVVLRHKKPQRFDIVTLDSHDAKEKIYIKRLIGLPGEHIVYHDGILTIGDTTYEETFLDPRLAFNEELESTTEDFEVTVPKDAYWVMGDNRGKSNDSRALGFISKKDIEGVFIWRFWPLNEWQIF